ncbi:MAG: hypothetical protein CSB48_02590 [Proteobacteria bacterium]|nr:MAG: hypothetical protein CSB48_02590 [Pseudomonadota bacterium]
MNKKIYIFIGIVIVVALITKAWSWLNDIPPSQTVTGKQEENPGEEKPLPVTNDWRLALLDSVNIKSENDIKQSVNEHFERFNLNRKTGEVTPVESATKRFNWPLDLTKKPYDAPPSAQNIHIRHLPEILPFWRLAGSDILIVPVVAKGKYGLSAGFVAIDSPGKTIAGVRFYHSEDTPGMGQDVLMADFGSRFVGKHLFDKNGSFALRIVQPEKTGKTTFDVDGISGATITSSGIQAALEFWFSKEAYASLL